MIISDGAPWIQFEWLQDERLRNAWGLEVPVHVLRYQSRDPSTGAPSPWRTVYMEPGTFPHVAYRETSATVDVEDPFDFLFKQWAYVETSVGNTTHYLPDDARLAPDFPCELSLVMARARASDGNLSLPDGCRLFDGEAAGVLLVPAGKGRIGSIMAERYRYDPPGPSARPLWAWAATQVPYFLRFEQEGEMHGDPAALTYLAGFTRGQDPLQVPTGPPGPPPGEVRMRPAEFDGPNDDGVDHNFTASRAMEFATGAYEETPFDTEEGKTHRNVTRFYADHPDAYVESANLRVRRTNYDQWIWTITLRAADESLTICPYRENTPLVEELGPGSPGYDNHKIQFDTRKDKCTAPPAPSHLSPQGPLSLPSLEWLQSQWRIFVPPERADLRPDFYAWSTSCDSPDCATPKTRLFIGHRFTKFTENSKDPLEGISESTLASVLVVDETGRAVSYTNMEQMREREVVESGVAIDAAANLDPPSEAEYATRLDAHAVAWEVPRSAALATVGLAALLAGALYWFASSLRESVWLPLYARVVGQRALESPSRAEILRAVAGDPGVALPRLTERLQMGRSTLRHHLRLLQYNKLVTVRRVRGTRRVFPPHYDIAAWVQKQVLDEDPSLRALFAFLQDHPTVSVRDAVSHLRTSLQVTDTGARKILRRAAGLGTVRLAGNPSVLQVIEPTLRKDNAVAGVNDPEPSSSESPTARIDGGEAA